MRRPLLLATAMLLAAGCGDNTPPEPPTARDLHGLWLISERTPAGDDVVEPETRGGAPHAVRGDGVFTATGHLTGTWHLRYLVLDDGLVTAAPAPISYAVELEPDRWVLTAPDGAVAAYESELVGDRLMLRWDAYDPRGTATPPSTGFALDRAPPWSTAMVGTWDVVSLETSTASVPADTCIGDTHSASRFEMTWVVDRHLAIDRTRNDFYYSDLFLPPLPPGEPPPPPCASLLDERYMHDRAMAEHDDAALRVWSLSGPHDLEPGHAHTYEVERTGDLATLTLTSCLPAPDCEHEALFERGAAAGSMVVGVVLRRR